MSFSTSTILARRRLLLRSADLIAHSAAFTRASFARRCKATCRVPALRASLAADLSAAALSAAVALSKRSLSVNAVGSSSPLPSLREAAPKKVSIICSTSLTLTSSFCRNGGPLLFLAALLFLPAAFSSLAFTINISAASAKSHRALAAATSSFTPCLMRDLATSTESPSSRGVWTGVSRSRPAMSRASSFGVISTAMLPLVTASGRQPKNCYQSRIAH
mmetsp:Transcript_5879/g.12892  ORF Transcript_5879/g.12892 Transcript_5879/m.12892 type:complete len:219 (+) Transcript_5879:778-1434(+)